MQEILPMTVGRLPAPALEMESVVTHKQGNNADSTRTDVKELHQRCLRESCLSDANKNHLPCQIMQI